MTTPINATSTTELTKEVEAQNTGGASGNKEGRMALYHPTDLNPNGEVLYKVRGKPQGVRGGTEYSTIRGF